MSRLSYHPTSDDQLLLIDNKPIINYDQVIELVSRGSQLPLFIVLVLVSNQLAAGRQPEWPSVSVTRPKCIRTERSQRHADD